MTASTEKPFQVPLTCQICGQKFAALEGYIARHGHKKIKGENGQRGHVTKGCDGSRERPFENSRHHLGVYLASDGLSDDERDRQQKRHDAWVQTISDNAWYQNSRIAMHLKRSVATRNGWKVRRERAPAKVAREFAILVESGVEVARYAYDANGGIQEFIPNRFRSYDLIDTHADLSTVPPEIATQLAQVAA